MSFKRTPTATRAPRLALLPCVLLAAPLYAATLGGTLTDADTGQPVANRRVDLMTSTPFAATVRTLLTDAAGGYQFSDVVDGSYYLVARPAGYLQRVYGDSGMGSTCTAMIGDNICLAASGAPIPLQAGQNLSVSMTSTRAAQVSGRVLGRTQAGQIIAVGPAFAVAGTPQGSLPFNVHPVSGHFFIDHIVPGPHVVRACATGWICRDPQGVESDSFGSDQPSSPLDLAAGQITDVGELVLRPAAQLSILPQFPPGTTRIDRYPDLRIHRDGAGSLQLGYDLDDAFQFNTLRPGTFRVRVAMADDPAWIGTWLGGATCIPEHCDPADATPVSLLAGQSLHVAPIAVPRQSISGTVRSALDGQPLAGIEVSAGRWSAPATRSGPQIRASVLTDATGQFQLSGLLPGDYLLRAQRLTGSAPWISERWPDVRCASIDTDCLPVGQHQFQLGVFQLAHGVDFTLELGGLLTGRIYDPVLGLSTPLQATAVHLLPVDPAPGNAAWVTIAIDPTSTRWTSTALPAGGYRVAATASQPSQGQSHTQLFDAVDCPYADPASCPLVQATVLEVSAGGSRDLVDFRIDSAEVLLQSNFE